jgi:hypothetical protein
LNCGFLRAGRSEGIYRGNDEEWDEDGGAVTERREREGEDLKEYVEDVEDC